MKEKIATILIAILVSSIFAYGETMLDYFKSRKPAELPISQQGRQVTIPVLQNHTAVRMLNPSGLRPVLKNMTTGWSQLTGVPAEFPPDVHSQSADTITNGVNNKAFTATEKTKLATIQAGATANSPDVFLLDRINHTGTQPATSITGLAAVATSGSYGDLNGKPPIPDPQVNADWLATSGIAQILNKPAETCNGRYAWDGSQIFITAGGCAAGTGYEGDICIDSVAPNIMSQRLNNTWEVKGTLQGTPGKTYSCTITGGIRSLLYDKNGANPAPTMVAFGVELREDGAIVTPESYSWSVPASGSLLSGSSIVSTFIPTVAGTFSAGAADNRVDAIVTYAGQTCSATAPVPATKVGADGAQGSDTKQQIYAKVAAGSNGDVLVTQCGPGDAASFVPRTVRDPSGNVFLSYTCGGLVTVYQLPSDASSVVKLAVRGLDGVDHFSVTAGGTLVLR